MHEEKRKHPRIPSQAQAQFRAVEGEQWGVGFEEGNVENISRGGVFVATDNPLPRGTMVDMRLALESGVKPVKATALVRWTRERFDPNGMGLEFLEFAGDGSSKLAAWLEKARKP